MNLGKMRLVRAHLCQLFACSENELLQRLPLYAASKFDPIAVINAKVAMQREFVLGAVASPNEWLVKLLKDLLCYIQLQDEGVRESLEPKREASPGKAEKKAKAKASNLKAVTYTPKPASRVIQVDLNKPSTGQRSDEGKGAAVKEAEAGEDEIRR